MMGPSDPCTTSESPLSAWAAITGVMRRATSKDTKTAADTVRPNCLKNCPLIPAHETDREEDGDDGEGRGHDGQADFIRGIDGRLITALPHPHVADDVFDLHDGIVHQHPRDQGQAQQRDLVEGEPHPIHEGERRDCGQGNGQRRESAWRANCAERTTPRPPPARTLR